MSQRAFRRLNKYFLKVNKKIMKFAILTKEWLNNKGVVIQPEWRHNIAKTEYILHQDMISPLLNDTDNITFYEYDNTEFINIINSPSWVLPEREEILRSSRRR